MTDYQPKVVAYLSERLGLQVLWTCEKSDGGCQLKNQLSLFYGSSAAKDELQTLISLGLDLAASILVLGCYHGSKSPSAPCV